MAKLEILNKICTANGLPPADVLAAGDRANACINHADLTSLLYIQGY